MSNGRPALPLEEAITRPLKSVRLAASTSFTAPEVEVLSAILAKLRIGADPSLLVRKPEVANIARKVEAMKGTIARQRERRAAKAAP